MLGSNIVTKGTWSRMQEPAFLSSCSLMGIEEILAWSCVCFSHSGTDSGRLVPVSLSIHYHSLGNALSWSQGFLEGWAEESWERRISQSLGSVSNLAPRIASLNTKVHGTHMAPANLYTQSQSHSLSHKHTIPMAETFIFCLPPSLLPSFTHI